MLDERVDAAGGLADAGLHHVLGELLFVEGHHFLHIAHAALQVLAEGDDLANDHGRAGQRLHHAKLSTLDALGDFDFAFTGEQRDGAHLAQVHADGVVGLFQRSRGQVQLDVFALFEVEVLVAAELGPVEQVDALGADGGNQVVQIVGIVHIVRQHVVHVAVSQIALFLARIDQV